MVWLPNASEAGDKLAAEAAPAPERLTVCGLPRASSAIVNAAVRAPVAEGVNVTLKVQLALGATVEPQLFVCAKSPLLAPVIEMLDRFIVAPPVLVSVTV